MPVFEPINSIIISWLGPFKLDELDRDNDPNVIYLIAGKKKYGRKVKVLYVGLTKRTAYQRISEHKRSPNKANIRWDTVEIWIGYIQHPAPCDAKTLGLVEHYLIHYSLPELNDKKQSRPTRAACVVSQWRKKDTEPYLHKQPIHEGLPDVIWWDKSHWRCGNLSVRRGE